MPNFLDENGLQQLKTNLDNLYARRAAITAGTAGSTTDTSGSSITIPYVTMNDAGIVTGYGTKTHTVNTVEPPTITYTQESTTTSSMVTYRHKIVITRQNSSGTTSYYFYANKKTTSGSYTSYPYAVTMSSFTGTSTTVYTEYTYPTKGETRDWYLIASTRNGSVDSYAVAMYGVTSGTACGCNCSCSCSCGGCSCGST